MSLGGRLHGRKLLSHRLMRQHSIQRGVHRGQEVFDAGENHSYRRWSI